MTKRLTTIGVMQTRQLGDLRSTSKVITVQERCRTFFVNSTGHFQMRIHYIRKLGCSQYKLLIRLDSADKREFYSAEAVKNNWTVRQLERQIYSRLQERLLASHDRESVLAIARNEKEASNAREIIKDPSSTSCNSSICNRNRSFPTKRQYPAEVWS